jgi:hypothetical protein
MTRKDFIVYWKIGSGLELKKRNTFKISYIGFCIIIVNF